MDDQIFEMDSVPEIIERFKRLSEYEQLEFFKIIEKKFFLFPSSMISDLLFSLFFLSNVAPIIAIEIFKLIRPTELSDKFIERIISLLKCPSLNISYKLTFIQSLFKHFPHSYFFNVYKDLLFHMELDYDMIYKHVIASQDFLMPEYQNKTISKDDEEGKNICNDYFYKLLIFSFSNMITPYKILLSQFILNSIYKWVLYDTVIPYLYSVLTDHDMDHALRMDVADILLNTEIISEEIREKAIQIIFDYGTENNQYSIYHNKENVHYFDQSSINQILDHLNSLYPLKIKTSYLYHLLDIDPEISANDKKLVQVAIIRIQNDYSTYGKCSNTLHDIFNMMYCYIEKHKYKSELQKRLLEEIIDMSGKCSTGYVVRLLNVLSGYDDFQIQISPEDSLKHLLYHYINKDITNIENEELQANVLFELSISSDLPGLRPNFLAFFRENFPRWRDDLSEAMKEIMTPTDFDLYLRKAIYLYEGC